MTVVDETKEVASDAAASGAAASGDVEESKSKYVSSDWSVDRRGSIKALMTSKKAEERFDLPEDTYAFLVVCPVFSWPFLFSVYVLLTKMTIMFILAYGIEVREEFNKTDGILPTIVKFFLIPVAIAMQEDLIGAYWFYANVIYCPKMLDKSKHATKGKLYFSYAVRTFDGLLSLYVNFMVMLTTADTLGIFLNFAALQFLQSIDDVFYELVVQGFFGDTLEHMSTICKDITVARRFGDDNKKIACFRLSHLDTVLFAVTFFVCLVAYIASTVLSFTDLSLPDAA